MPEDRISPEEKLLNLIRDRKEGGGEKKKASPLENKKKPKTRKIISIHPGLKSILIFIVILLFGLMVYESGLKVKEEDTVDFRGPRERVKKITGEEPLILKPYSYYSQAIEGKSLFSPLVIEEKTATAIAKGEKIEKIEELAKSYRLKGIILGESGERPKAFIEDSQAHRTFTVTIGDSIGKLQVKDIKEGRVTLSYEEETYELSF